MLEVGAGSDTRPRCWQSLQSRWLPWRAMELWLLQRRKRCGALAIAMWWWWKVTAHWAGSLRHLTMQSSSRRRRRVFLLLYWNNWLQVEDLSYPSAMLISRPCNSFTSSRMAQSPGPCWKAAALFRSLDGTDSPPELRDSAMCYWLTPCQQLAANGDLLQYSVPLFTDIKITLEMIKWEHSIFALPFALCGAMLAAGGLPSAAQLGWIILCMVSARSAAMAFNRLADAQIDAANPRTATRAIPAGVLSRNLWASLLSFPAPSLSSVLRNSTV